MSLFMFPFGKEEDEYEAESDAIEALRHTLAPRPTQADVFETETEYIIQVELPGAKPDSIKIALSPSKDMLYISALVACPEDKSYKYHLKERVCGEFKRTFSINGVSGDHLFSQTYINGILEIKAKKS